MNTTIDIKVEENLNMELITTDDEAFRRINKQFLHEIINYF